MQWGNGRERSVNDEDGPVDSGGRTRRRMRTGPKRAKILAILWATDSTAGPDVEQTFFLTQKIGQNCFKGKFYCGNKQKNA